MLFASEEERWWRAVLVRLGEPIDALRSPSGCPSEQRTLAAQAQIEQALFVSNETLFDRFAVRRLW